MSIMNLLVRAGLAAATLSLAAAVPAAASDIRPGVSNSFNGTSGPFAGNYTMVPLDVPVQLPGNGIGLAGTGSGGGAD